MTCSMANAPTPDAGSATAWAPRAPRCDTAGMISPHRLGQVFLAADGREIVVAWVEGGGAPIVSVRSPISLQEAGEWAMGEGAVGIVTRRIGEEQGYWGQREITSVPARYRPGASDVLALRVGYEKLNRETGWEPKVSWEEGVANTIAWYAANRHRWIGRVDWLTPAAARA